MLKRLKRALARPEGRRAPASSDARNTIALCRTLLSDRGELSGARLAAEALASYQSLEDRGRDAFFDLLVSDFSPSENAILRQATAYHSNPTPANLARLQTVVEPPRQELFRRFNLAPGGTAVLVKMRNQLRATLTAHPDRSVIEADLVHLFRSWFNRGFLALQRIDWHTSAIVLERLIAYESVHAIQGWSDLHRRLEADRRCYAFFHPALPDEPLIFIEVALTRGLPAHVQPLLDPDAPVADPLKADYAVFYSITNCQAGLRGISFGNFLIQQGVQELGSEFRARRQFATLSPVPGFRGWLQDLASEKGTRCSPALAALLSSDARSALQRYARDAALRRELLGLCAHYLMHVKGEEGPLDPVARFHLANGARLERLNWMGDTSPAGLDRSLGITVNYVYDLGDLERNHQAYAHEYTVTASRELERLARQTLRR